MDRCWRLGSQLTGFSSGKQITLCRVLVPMYSVHYTNYKMFSGTETAHCSCAKPSGGSLPCVINNRAYIFEVDILVGTVTTTFGRAMK